MSGAFPFQVIDTHFGYPDGITGALLSMAFRVPFTVTLRGSEPKHSRNILGRYFMKWALRRAARVFTVSERLRQFAISFGARAERVQTIPNGVDATVFFPRDRVECRLKYKLALDCPVILSVGALVERKGHHRIIEALHGLSQAGLDAQLIIAGGPGPEGNFEKEIHRAIKDFKLEAAVRLVGPVSPGEIAELMSAADVFCLSSTNEGWPNVVHEALACGTPVVATDVGAVPEMVAQGQRGFVVPANDPSALEGALREALARDWNRRALSEWGHQRSWQQVAREVYEQLQLVVGETRGTEMPTK
jgi:glycosyltransferase involved in cell wall biosynthesis